MCTYGGNCGAGCVGGNIIVGAVENGCAWGVDPLLETGVCGSSIKVTKYQFAWFLASFCVRVYKA